MKPSVSNSAQTVEALFYEAIQQYGLPSRVRGDQGAENVLVAIVMILLCGRNQGSFLWGE